ncbi:hypothetical protein [Streptomyces sp. NBC_00648]|uniref:hypothetical protein n=1 Tax=Streptomyces sp. NBC_00648 TaxID=2975797 RepID=UPI003255A67B
MPSAARFLWRSLTAVLVSIAVVWAPTAFSAPGVVVKQESILLAPSTGPPGTSVHVSFKSCATPGYISGIKWDQDYIDFNATDEAGGADISVPADAAAGAHDVAARCYKGADGAFYGTGTFTVTAPADPEITLHPTEGAPQTTVTVSGSGFNCSYVDVTWDGTRLVGADVTSEGAINAEFPVPAGSPETTYTVRAACTDYPDRSGEAVFTVRDPGTDGTATTGDTSGDTSGDTNGTTTGDTNGTTSGDTNGTTSGDTSGDTNGTTSGDTNGTTAGDTSGDTDGTTTGDTAGDTDGTGSVTGSTDGADGGGTAIPAGWVVGPSLFGGLLLLAALFSLLNHRHRGPRWVHDHIRAALRPGAGTVALQERRNTGSANRAVRLEPHADPGDQRLY